MPINSKNKPNKNCAMGFPKLMTRTNGEIETVVLFRNKHEGKALYYFHDEEEKYVVGEVHNYCSNDFKEYIGDHYKEYIDILTLRNE